MFFDIFDLMKGFLLIWLMFPVQVFGQSYFSTHFGGSVGLVLNLGSHLHSVGVNVRTYYTDYFFQINATSTLYFHGSHWGNRKQFIETRSSLGAVLLAGKKDAEIDFQLDGLNHQTSYRYGIGYNYVWYMDTRSTSQRSGGFSMHLNKVTVYHENDVFAGQAKDRFRTGHLLVTYQMNEFKWGLGVNLWTGETANSRWERISMDKLPNGYRSLEENLYGKTSHGVFYGSFSYQLPYSQDVHLKLGVDSEQVRHLIQNRLTHDLFFLPKRFVRNTPHYPRLDENGCPVFSKEDMRSNRFFMQFGSNENWSY